MELSADDCRTLDHGARIGRELVEPFSEKCLNRGRQVRFRVRAFVGQLRGHLFEEERISFGRLRDLEAHRSRDRVAVAQPLEQGVRFGRAQRLQRH